MAIVSIGNLKYELSELHAKASVCGVNRDDICDTAFSVIIPSFFKYNNKKYDVVSIEAKAFIKCSGLISVTIPNSIVNIGDSAFALCSNLDSLVVPDSVRNIGFAAFRGVKNVVYHGRASWKLDDYHWRALSLNGYVEDSLVYDSKAKKKLLGCFSSATERIMIPEGVLIVSENAFSFCSDIKSVVIPDSVTIIQSFAFAFCARLTTVIIGKGVQEVAENAFIGCNDLKEIYVPIGMKEFYCKMGLDEHVLVKEIDYAITIH